MDYCKWFKRAGLASAVLSLRGVNSSYGGRVVATPDVASLAPAEIAGSFNGMSMSRVIR